MNSLLRVLNKPEYFYNPRQFLKRLAQVVQKAPKGESRARVFGQEFVYSPSDDIGRAVHSFGLYDLCVSEVLWVLAAKGDTVCDIGANIGYFSNLLSVKVGASGKVHAFEPNPQVMSQLIQNTSQRQNVVIHSMGLSDSARAVSLFAPQSYDGNRGLASMEDSSGEEIAQVSVLPLDELKVMPVLIKMDVEGHELSVLRGAVESLKSTQHIIFEDHDLEKNGVKSFLEENGFSVYYLEKNFSFLRLRDSNKPFSVNRSEPPNFLATRWTDEVVQSAFQSSYWVFLRAMDSYR